MRPSTVTVSISDGAGADRVMPGSSPAESAPVMASSCGMWAAVEPNEAPVDPWADLHAPDLVRPYRPGRGSVR